jgi:hypothetical protein
VKERKNSWCASYSSNPSSWSANGCNAISRIESSRCLRPSKRRVGKLWNAAAGVRLLRDSVSPWFFVHHRGTKTQSKNFINPVHAFYRMNARRNKVQSKGKLLQRTEQYFGMLLRLKFPLPVIQIKL